MKNLVIYIHGKNGNANESEHYKPFFAGYDVIGFDYKAENVWDAVEEFQKFFDCHCERYEKIILIANSIGAYFTMHALKDEKIDRAFFISPIADMEKLIKNLMAFENVTEDELREKKEIPTKFGENLSWQYLCYVRENKIVWNISTYILYGEKDNFTDKKTMTDFAEKIRADITIMKGGEHFFHTDEQMKFLDNWLRKIIKRKP